MTINLDDLKAKSGDMSAMLQEIESSNKGGFEDARDESLYWKPSVDQAGNGFALIRFLPSPDTDVNWQKYWDHGFKGPTGRWYIEKSLTSLGQTDPVGELNSKAWSEGRQDEARARKRRLKHVANILVIQDKAKPECEGKVFLYEYGKKIQSKIDEAIKPEFEDETPMNPFDLWNGADFAIKIRQVEGYRNYDKSEFKSPSKLFDGKTGKLQKLVDQLHNLSFVLDPSGFKTYDQLSERLANVLGVEVVNKMEDVPSQEPPLTEAKVGSDVSSNIDWQDNSSDDDEDDVMERFKRLAG